MAGYRKRLIDIDGPLRSRTPLGVKLGFISSSSRLWELEQERYKNCQTNKL